MDKKDNEHLDELLEKRKIWLHKDDKYLSAKFKVFLFFLVAFGVGFLFKAINVDLDSKMFFISSFLFVFYFIYTVNYREENNRLDALEDALKKLSRKYEEIKKE